MEIKNTKSIQLDSLDIFMKALGYTREWDEDEPQNFYSLWAPAWKAVRIISFNTAVKLYNGHYIEWHGKKFNPPFNFINAYEYNAANSLKIIKVVKLQYSKKKKEIKVQSDVVTFVKPEYYDLFLGEDNG